MPAPDASSRATSRMLANAWTLGIDVTTAEVLRGFREVGLQSIVLKGPTLQRELYGEESRRYTDTDLLVAPAELDRAAPVLSGLGFALAFDHRRHAVGEPHAQEWTRASPLRVVDLHWRVPGVRLEAQRAWEILSARTQPIDVAGAPATALDRGGIALLVALHAARHAPKMTRPAADLALALARFDLETWRAAAALAQQLDATQSMAAGLRSAPAGEALAATLGLPRTLAAEVRLDAAGAAPGAHVLLRLAQAPSIPARLRILREAVLPAPQFIRVHMPLARRGRASLVLAYVLRLLVRAGRLPTALRDVRRARS